MKRKYDNMISFERYFYMPDLIITVLRIKEPHIPARISEKEQREFRTVRAVHIRSPT